MAEGFSPVNHADGVYLNMPLGAYLADPALSGSAFKKLLSEPEALTWESEANPLWLKPEPIKNRFRLRGSAAHCAILEGVDAYEARYTVKPEGVMTSSAELKRWLSQKRAELIEAAPDSKLSKQKRDAVKQTGDFEELIERVLTLDPKAPIWVLDDDVETLHPADDQYVRLLERYVRNEEAFARLVTGGLPEVTIFWSEHGQRFKARIDYLTSHTVLDLKTFGQAPKRGRSLRAHCVAEAAFHGYDLQGVHNHRAVEVAAQACALGRIEITGGGFAEVEAAADLLKQAHAEGAVFRWLFLRMGGAPTGISIPFRESDGQWGEAQSQIAEACELHAELTKRFGADLWLLSHGEQEIQDMDWPLAAIRGA